MHPCKGMKEILDSYEKRKTAIKARLEDFSKVKKEDYFYELCFCLLTPQSNAKRAFSCIEELKKMDFQNKDINPKPVLHKKIRFHNNKSIYLKEAKQNYKEIEKAIETIKGSRELREFLVKNIKGFGYKEASHFLRNIGYKNLAILDRHILKNLEELKVIKIPKSLNKNNYLKIENKFQNFANKVNISMDELDLLFWSQETGEIFK